MRAYGFIVLFCLSLFGAPAGGGRRMSLTGCRTNR